MDRMCFMFNGDFLYITLFSLTLNIFIEDIIFMFFNDKFFDFICIELFLRECTCDLLCDDRMCFMFNVDFVNTL